MTPRAGRERGFSLIELLVSLAVFSLAMASLAALLLHNARTNRSQQMTLAAQGNARSCLSMILPVLRTAGWDPRNVGVVPLVLDGSGNGAFIQVRADLNEDGDTNDANEDVTIRFSSGRIEWRTTSDTTQPFVTLSEDITNDADGNGTAEPMFTPDATTHPTKIRTKITARSPVPDPRNGQYVRSTVTSDVILRASL